MGIMPPPKTCHVTGLLTENFPSSWDLVEYVIQVNGKNILFRFGFNHTNSDFVESNKYILQGLILNDKLGTEFYSVKTSPVLDNEKLEAIIRNAIVPKTPEEKIAHLLVYLHSLQEYEGSYINFSDKEDRQNLAKRLYFKNYDEMVFYLFTLKSQGLIDGIDVSSKDGRGLSGIQITFKGLSKVIEINESGVKSDKCFVAMSFSKELNNTRQAIKAAIKEAGFKPILIDEIHFDSDVTINDALIAEIKKSRFLVADFTQHKHGVYFEAGFALGLKRPVIYLCREEDFLNTHFDTNHYPHIIYTNEDELQQKLRIKIEAWIN